MKALMSVAWNWLPFESSVLVCITYRVQNDGKSLGSKMHYVLFEIISRNRLESQLIFLQVQKRKEKKRKLYNFLGNMVSLEILNAKDH